MANQSISDELRTAHPIIVFILAAIDKLCDWQGRIASTLIAVATLQICLEIVMRYVFNAPTVWGLEMTIYLCATTYILAGAYAEFHNAHIRVDIFYSLWSKRTQAIVDIFATDVLFFFFNGFLVWHSGIWFWESVTEGLTTGTVWDPPAWPMRLILFVGATFLLLAGFGRFVRNLLMAIWKIEVADE